MKCVFQAVQYIHSKSIVHRDLKPDNILVGDRNDLTTVKLADFGLSAKYDHVSFTTQDQHCGTLIFMAPEVALKKEYSKSVDVWSTGIILHMLLTGGVHPLFTSQDDTDTYKHKLSLLNQLEFPSHLSSLARNLFMKVTKFNIAQRYSAHDALRHPWITRINKTNIPLTLPDKMNQLEIADKLKAQLSVIYFASVVNVKQKIKGRNGNYSDEEKDMQNYKRLLDKVTKKIDKWHDEKDGRDLEKFEKDSEYIEVEGSPAHFSSSDDGSVEEGKNLFDSPGGGLKI